MDSIHSVLVFSQNSIYPEHKESQVKRHQRTGLCLEKSVVGDQARTTAYCSTIEVYEKKSWKLLNLVSHRLACPECPSMSIACTGLLGRKHGGGPPAESVGRGCVWLVWHVWQSLLSGNILICGMVKGQASQSHRHASSRGPEVSTWR